MNGGGQVTGTLSTGPEKDRPRSPFDDVFTAYGLDLINVTTNNHHERYGDHSTVTIELQSYSEEKPFDSTTYNNMRELFKDLSTLNKIKSGKFPGATKQWEQIETFLALADDKSK